VQDFPSGSQPPSANALVDNKIVNIKRSVDKRFFIVPPFASLLGNNNANYENCAKLLEIFGIAELFNRGDQVNKNYV